ncbi:DNA cytosine methyltransferase [Gemmatimonadota bacterium]
MNQRYTEQELFLRRTSGAALPGKDQFTLIDSFCGAGGLSLGFSEELGHSFHPVWANDLDKSSTETYSKNLKVDSQVGGIQQILRDDPGQIPPATVVLGGPPCQGFSLLNRNRSNDTRKALWQPFLEIVRISGARVFVMENVPQILRSREFQEISSAAGELGFRLASANLCAANYGVPQLRWRAFIIGARDHDPKRVFPPVKTHAKPKDSPVRVFFNGQGPFVEKPAAWRTVRDAIGDLPPPEGTTIRDDPPPFDLHFGRAPTELSRKRYRVVPDEGMNRFDLQERAPDLTPRCWLEKKTGGTDLFGRLWWDRPAYTIRTEFFKPEKGRYLHPSEHRPITHREAARFQSFPDTFHFVGKKIEIARQIGNAVPPDLAARIADAVLAILLSSGE